LAIAEAADEPALWWGMLRKLREYGAHVCRGCRRIGRVALEIETDANGFACARFTAHAASAIFPMRGKRLRNA
jgi:hypothetical protein